MYDRLFVSQFLGQKIYEWINRICNGMTVILMRLDHYHTRVGRGRRVANVSPDYAQWGETGVLNNSVCAAALAMPPVSPVAPCRFYESRR